MQAPTPSLKLTTELDLRDRARCERAQELRALYQLYGTTQRLTDAEAQRLLNAWPAK